MGVDDDSNDDTVKANSWGEDDDDEHADESGSILSGHKSRRGAQNSDADSAEQVGEADEDTDPEGSVGRVLSDLISLTAKVDVVPGTVDALLLKDE